MIQPFLPTPKDTNSDTEYSLSEGVREADVDVRYLGVHAVQEYCPSIRWAPTNECWRMSPMPGFELDLMALEVTGQS